MKNYNDEFHLGFWAEIQYNNNINKTEEAFMRKICKEEIYKFLEQNNVPFEAMEHRAVFTVAEADALKLPHPEAATKNLFLKDKKHRYFLLVARENAEVNLKELQSALSSASLHFSSSEELDKILGLIPGAVSPLGLLNDEERLVEVAIDDGLRGKLIAMHPNENTATVWMNEPELSKIIKEHGNKIRFVNL